MSIFGDEPTPKPPHELGQSLDGLSIADLDERIAMLRAEISRLEDDRRAKGAANSAAEMAFKPTMGQS